ncbi:helix-turn-helix transcriptional regulator [Streptomyces radicis]|uniref:LuxR family transcriptional regulator n=1 Tax=Streptomyces radicis TaxID=1750517 RepID=A0A3A9VXZ2_9ACTN|nr:LuxR family transcriptional regulator [Streptomyces radicis]RKN05838.1 LuxR family transcriptional regulator [Streptomyces radicis]RKN17608.1 LuxR family transcriptional regulator [Streptomyces radicis]
MALVERDYELKLLNELFAETNRGHGRIALISGAVASGKTELLHAFSDACADGGGHVLCATATSADTAVPFGVLRQLVEPLDLPADLAEGLAAPRVGPKALQALTARVLELSEREPLLLCVDDVHHADESSMESLLRLVKRMRSARVMLVLTEAACVWSVHPAFRIELVRQTRFRRFRLTPLSVDGVAEMLAQHLGQPAAWTLARETHHATGGNQLLVRALIEDYTDSVGLPGQVGGYAMGESFGQAVLTCLHRSAPETLDVARAMAVLDTTGSADRVAELLDREPKSVARALQALRSVGLVEGGRFRHSQIRSAIYDALDQHQLTRLHTRAARLLHDGAGGVTDVADHLVAARQVEADWAIAELQRAAERALAEDDEQAALRYAEFALSMCTVARQRAALRMLLTRIEWRSNPEAAARHLPPLFEAQREGHLDTAQTAALLRSVMWHGRTQDATELIERLPHLRTGEAGQPTEPLASTRHWLKHDCPQLLPPETEAAAQPATCGAGATGGAAAPGRATASPPGQQAQAAAVLRAVLGQGRDEDGRLTRVAEQILQTTALSDHTLEAVCSALQTLIYTEQLPMAARWCDSLLDEADARKVTWWQAVLSCCRAEISVRNGELAEAERQALGALRLIGVRGWGVAVGVPVGILLEVATSMGDFDSARKYLREPVPEVMFQTRYGLSYLRARGRYYLATDQLQAALANFRYCGDLMTAWGIDAPAFVPWRSDLAEVYLRLGEQERAQQLAKDQIARSGSRTSRTYGYSLRVLAATANHRARLRMLKESVEVLQARGDRMTLAQALADLSRVHHSLGDFGKARMISRRARRLTKECQAQPTTADEAAARPEKPLVVVADDAEAWTPPAEPGPPVRPPARPEPATGAGGGEVLTLSERRVAALASLGYTNREISGKLHITVSTVEQHLTKVFRKLRVKRRTDLPVDLELRAERSAC